jgi:hypothetical protein
MRISYPNLRNSSRCTRIPFSFAGRMKGEASPLLLLFPTFKMAVNCDTVSKGRGEITSNKNKEGKGRDIHEF